MNKCKVHKRLMGSDFELIVCGNEESQCQAWLQAGISEIERLEYLLTAFSTTSDTARINANAGIAPVAVQPEVAALIHRCLRLSALTQGAFDITSGNLKDLYPFKNASLPWPDEQTLQSALNATGYQQVQLSANNEVYLSKKEMRINFGAVGKGYAADCVKRMWMAAGVSSGVVNASGDLTAWGTQPDGTPWKVGIADPDCPDRALLWVPVNNASVATSGNYIQYIDRDSIRYSHNIDPISGKPARFLKSVTIVAPGAELADALATAVTIMGTDIGLNFINQLPGVHCIIIDDNNRIFMSDQIKTSAHHEAEIQL